MNLWQPEQNELEALLSQDLDQNAHSDKLDANCSSPILHGTQGSARNGGFLAPWVFGADVWNPYGKTQQRK